MPSDAGVEVWAAAAVATVSAELIAHPLDTVITRIQSPTYHEHYKTRLGAVRPQLVQGLYQGFGPTLVAGVPSSVAFFTIYEWMKSSLERARSDGNLGTIPQPAIHAISSVAADLVGCAIYNPAEVIKQNAQVQRGSSSSSTGHTIATLRYFVARPSRLWAGYSIVVARSLPTISLTMTLHEYFKTLILRRLGETDPKVAKSVSRQFQVSTMSAGLAGGLTASLSVPLDVILTRMRLAAGSHSTSIQKNQSTISSGLSKGNLRKMRIFPVVREILRVEGLPGLFRGFSLTCIAATFGSGVYLGCYEGCKLYFERFVAPSDEPL